MTSTIPELSRRLWRTFWCRLRDLRPFTPRIELHHGATPLAESVLNRYLPA